MFFDGCGGIDTNQSERFPIVLDVNYDNPTIWIVKDSTDM